MSDCHCERACEILRRTRDGEDLSPGHLYLIQLVVNGDANERGIAEFEKVYADVMGGTYKRPWYWGIEHLTHDHVGYVYWRGVLVEHFDFEHSEQGARAEKAASEKLARVCRHLEARGISPDRHNAYREPDPANPSPGPA